jgi:hypothetical protein
MRDPWLAEPRSTSTIDNGLSAAITRSDDVCMPRPRHEKGSSAFNPALTTSEWTEPVGLGLKLGLKFNGTCTSKHNLWG